MSLLHHAPKVVPLSIEAQDPWSACDHRHRATVDRRRWLCDMGAASLLLHSPSLPKPF